MWEIKFNELDLANEHASKMSNKENKQDYNPVLFYYNLLLKTL